MRIELSEVGGYAGTIPVKEVNTEDKQVVNKINELVNKADFSNSTTEPEELGADIMKYEVKVTDGGQTKTLTFANSTEANIAADHPGFELYNYIKNL
jgi:hypothetical protein